MMVTLLYKATPNVKQPGYRWISAGGLLAVIIWIIASGFVSAAVGAVLYFLLRQPLVSRCPACSTFVQSDFHFCPQCDYQLTASCGNCFRTVRATDQFCTRCGHELATDKMPARLRVMAE